MVLMINFLKELLKEPKAVRDLALVIICLVLLGIVYQQNKDNALAWKEQAEATRDNTAVLGRVEGVVTQFQTLLSQKNTRSAIMESIVQK